MINQLIKRRERVFEATNISEQSLTVDFSLTGLKTN